MKRAFLITSSIEINPNDPLKGKVPRSAFSTNERLNQTISTLINLKHRDPSASIYLIDSSVSAFEQLSSLNLENFYYKRLQDLNPQIAHTVRTYSSKSYCECLMILEFLKHFKQDLKKFDFVTKICGRYILDQDYNLDVFQFSKKNKFFMKKALVWQGEDINFLKTNYSESVLPRDILFNDKLYGYYTVVHAFGIYKLDHYEILMAASAQLQTEQGKFYHQDIEYTLHYLMRKLDLIKDVEIVNWTIDGFCGLTGKGVRY